LLSIVFFRTIERKKCRQKKQEIGPAQGFVETARREKVIRHHQSTISKRKKREEAGNSENRKLPATQLCF
jgi:hypothetical protein